MPETVVRNIAEIFSPTLFLASTKGNNSTFEKSLKVNSEGAGFRKSNGSGDKTSKIKDEVIIRDHSGVPALYVFNYEKDKGYLIVSGDSSLRPVLAYVEKGNFQNGKAPGGAVMWLNKTINNVEVVRKGLFDNRKSATHAWKKYFDEMTKMDNQSSNTNSGVKGNFIDPTTIDPCSLDPNYYDAQSITIGPLLPTQWGQLDTYNDLLTNQNCGSSFNGAPPTGCVATAMAQVIRYWQTPTTQFNYAGMPSNIGNNFVQQLMVDAGTSVSMQYDCTGSHPPNEVWLPGGILITPSSSERIANALTGTFGYSSASYGTYHLNNSDYMTVQSNIANYQPVIFGGYSDWNSFWYYPEGTGHVWVCDGTLQTVYTFCSNGSSMSETSLMFHMNWGWQEWGTTNNFNGWFAFDSWYISQIGKQYVYFNDYAYNIHP